jgi:glycerol-3-phosphate acyltransferase PlsY
VQIITYLYGSIPFGYWLALKLKKINVRNMGSGNIGATNITRILGLKFGFVSFLFDFSKGFLPYLISSYIFPSMPKDLLLLICSLGIIGHDFSPFLSFKGGKGIGTTFGLAVIFHYPSALLVLFLWIVMILLTGYVSLASIIGVCLIPLLYYLFGITRIYPLSIVFAIFFSILGIFQHRSNLARLFSHTEKVTFKKNLFHNS